MTAPGRVAFVPHVGWLEHEPGDEVIEQLRQGHFEAGEQSFIWRYLREGDSFLDCGAHLGLYTLLCARVAGGAGKRIAIEANPRTARLLKRNLARNEVAATVVAAAAWRDERGVRLSHEDPGRAAYVSVLGGDDGEAAPAPSIRIDSVLSRHAPNGVAFAKIDVEGAEFEVLEGAESSLRSGRLPIVMIEFTRRIAMQRGHTLEQLAEHLRSYGYVVCAYDADANALVEVTDFSTVWHLNAIATLDFSGTNERLAQASQHVSVIASDILDRARACARLKELQELDRYKLIAAESERRAEWAMGLEQRLSEQTRLAEERRAWAETAEAALADQTRAAAENRAWAENTEAALADQTRTAAENRAWAENTEAALTDRTRAAAENRAWAERAELALSEQRRTSDLLQQRVEECEAELAELDWARKALVRLRSWGIARRG